MTFKPRHVVLRDLVSARQPIEQTIWRVKALPWDSNRVLVILYRTDMSRLLRRYLHGEVSGKQCTAWADAIEARDDIGFEYGQAELLKRLIFELANPELEGQISPEAASAWLRMLEAESANLELDSDEPGLPGEGPERGAR